MLRPPDELHQRVGEDASDELPCSGDSHAFELVPDRTLREPWNASLPLLRLLCTVTTSIAAFWSSGPGGVGQRPMSHLLDSTFGELHRYVDMSVYAMTRCVSSPNCSQAHWLSLAGRALKQTDLCERTSSRGISAATPWLVVLPTLCSRRW